jgi:feruloyl esterase
VNDKIGVKIILLGAGFLLAGLIDVPPAAATASVCTAPALQALAPAGIVVASAGSAKTAKGSGYCLVEGTMPTSGNRLRFRLGLPQTWNGKFLFEGVGGAVGLLVDVSDGVGRGYAVATTDTGHQGNTADFTWALNAPDKKLDWAYRGVHTAAVGTKALVQSYYSHPLQHAYYRGCSNGGRAGLMEAQRYPADFDGILAGAPALNATSTTLGWVWNMQALSATPQSRLSPAAWELVGRTIREDCDALDGLRDGIIEDPRRCRLPRQRLLCNGAKHDGCLSAPQLEALEKIWNKPVLANGQKLFSEGHGYEDQPMVWGAYADVPPLVLLHFLHRTQRPGDGLESSAPLPPPPLWRVLPWLFTGAPAFHRMTARDLLRYLFNDDPQLDLNRYDIEKQGPALMARWSSVVDATDPDLAPYLRQNAKLLLWHGWADSALPPEGTVDYYWRARSATLQQGLSPQAFDDDVRLYMVPTMPHCARGPGPTEADLLGTLDRWVSQGSTPQAITAVQRADDGTVVRSRPLCPAPEEARYKGTGPVDEAGSFECRAEAGAAP